MQSFPAYPVAVQQHHANVPRTSRETPEGGLYPNRTGRNHSVQPGVPGYPLFCYDYSTISNQHRLGMLNELIQHYGNQLETLQYLLILISGILHLLFAGAVARDAGSLRAAGQQTALVSAATWAFATLIGGVITAAIYWFIHHSTLTRPVRP